MKEVRAARGLTHGGDGDDDDVGVRITLVTAAVRD
jgi:hypothetical protein